MRIPEIQALEVAIGQIAHLRTQYDFFPLNHIHKISIDYTEDFYCGLVLVARTRDAFLAPNTRSEGAYCSRTFHTLKLGAD